MFLKKLNSEQLWCGNKNILGMTAHFDDRRIESYQNCICPEDRGSRVFETSAYQSTHYGAGGFEVSAAK
jgi:hypothetical protein